MRSSRAKRKFRRRSESEEDDSEPKHEEKPSTPAPCRLSFAVDDASDGGDGCSAKRLKIGSAASSSQTVFSSRVRRAAAAAAPKKPTNLQPQSGEYTSETILQLKKLARPYPGSGSAAQVSSSSLSISSSSDNEDDVPVIVPDKDDEEEEDIQQRIGVLSGGMKEGTRDVLSGSASESTNSAFGDLHDDDEDEEERKWQEKQLTNALGRKIEDAPVPATVPVIGPQPFAGHSAKFAPAGVTAFAPQNARTIAQQAEVATKVFHDNLSELRETHKATLNSLDRAKAQLRAVLSEIASSEIKTDWKTLWKQLITGKLTRLQ